MQGETFASNPVGVEFDPEALLASYRNGVTLETLMVMPQGPPSGIPEQHGMS